jgi:hypothetical protein
MDRRNVESLLNPRVFVVVTVIAVLGSTARSTDQHSSKHERTKSYGHTQKAKSVSWSHFIFLSSSLSIIHLTVFGVTLTLPAAGCGAATRSQV